jgi:hypothetical protein
MLLAPRSPSPRLEIVGDPEALTPYEDLRFFSKYAIIVGILETFAVTRTAKSPEQSIRLIGKIL